MASKPLLANATEMVHRPAVRNRQIGVRLTQGEYADLEQIAWKCGKTIGDWTRDVLLCAETTDKNSEMEMHIFTELVGLQMLLMGTLEPLLRGENIAAENINVLFRQVQTTKAAKAQELLAKRSQNREK
jgi:hypothetical protein